MISTDELASDIELVKTSKEAEYFGRYKSYEAYKRSSEWRAVVKKIIVRDPKCVGCERNSTEAHHRCYRRSAMDGTDLRFMVGICRDCHDSIHVHRTRNRFGGRFLKWEETEARLFEKISAKQCT